MKLGTIFSAAIAFAVVGCATPSQIFADAEVDRLCAIDGGIRVYETVTLPPAEYERYAKRNWVLPNKAGAKLIDEYYFEWSVTYLKRGTPELFRSEYRIVRKVDGKTMGNFVGYTRRGGDVPGPWHDSSFTCPEIGSQPSLEKSIFYRGE